MNCVAGINFYRVPAGWAVQGAVDAEQKLCRMESRSVAADVCVRPPVLTLYTRHGLCRGQLESPAPLFTAEAI